MVVVFFGGIKFGVVGGIIIAAILMKNMIPRIKTDQAVKFFLGPMTAIAVIAALLALLGY